MKDATFLKVTYTKMFHLSNVFKVFMLVFLLDDEIFLKVASKIK